MDFAGREAPLVEHDHAVIGPLYRLGYIHAVS
jgi:hypothetical protein